MADWSKPLTIEELKEIGKSEYLDDLGASDFARFIKKRFPDEFSRNYAREWARRFYEGREWASADGQSKKALISVNPDKYEGR